MPHTRKGCSFKEGTQSFFCSHCDKSYTSEYAIKLHLKVAHGVSKSKADKGGLCVRCGAHFSNDF